MSMSILTVRTWSQLLLDLYKTTINKLPAPKVTSSDGEYSYTFKTLQLSTDARNFEEEVCRRNRIKTEAEKFTYTYHLIQPCKDQETGRFVWKSDEPIITVYVISKIAELIRYYDPDDRFVSNLKPGRCTPLESDISLLITRDIFNGISNKSINKLLDLPMMSYSDAEVIVENTKKYFKNRFDEYLH